MQVNWIRGQPYYKTDIARAHAMLFKLNANALENKLEEVKDHEGVDFQKEFLSIYQNPDRDERLHTYFGIGEDDKS